MTVELLERRFREDYQGQFRADIDGEMGALYLLLAYDFYAQQSVPTEVVDILKFHLMHALRWGRNATSQPLTSSPAQTDPDLFNKFWEVLRYANGYTGAYGAFRLFEKGVITIESISDQSITFNGNPAWEAYNELDRQIQERPHPNDHRSKTIATVNHIVENVLTYFTFPDYFPNINDFCNALPEMQHLAEEGFELPDSWDFDGVPIAILRQFWTALMLWGMVHNAVSHRRFGCHNPNLHHLVIRRKDRLIGWLADCLTLDKAILARLIDLHIYDRQHNLPDIALPPLLALSDDLLAFSPWLVLTSRFERNFAAFVARNYKAQYDAATDGLAPLMAAQIAEAFREAGFKAKLSVPIRTSKGDGDIDLLVWSPEERYVLGIELKWVIGVADVMEVLNRGESTCSASIKKQIPKYCEALSQSVGVLLQRAFSLGEVPSIDGWSCALMTRGFIGSPRIVNGQCLFIAEQFALEKLASRCSLRDFCDWARVMPYLPVEGREFRMTPVSTTSPSGLTVTYWERDRIKAEAEGK